MTFYDQIARDYDRHRRPGGPFLPVLVRLADQCAARHVVEIGPGTGNNTAAFLREHPCELTGVDVSLGMLRQARAKQLSARLVNGDGCALPLAPRCCNFAFAVLVLQHIDDLAALCRECHRILDSGLVAFVTASHEFIDRHPMNAYFPSFAAVDKARFPSIDKIHAALKDAGFHGLGVEHTKDAPRPIDAHYVQRVAGQFISTYALLPPEEFEEGVARLQREIAARGRLEKMMEWEAAVVWGRKDSGPV